LLRSIAVILSITRIIEYRVLMYSFIVRNEELNDQAHCVAQKGIYLEALRDLAVMFPFLPELKKLTALDALKKSILHKAFAGEL
jgi:hypothetical protein